MTFPSTAGLRKSLECFVGKSTYVIPIADPQTGRALGNNGDVLLHMVFSRILDEFSITVVRDPHVADFLSVPPSGSLLERYHFPTILRDHLRSLPDKPLAIFPSSADFPTADPATIFAGRRAPSMWILRERPSYEHLSERWGEPLESVGVTLLLDHDVVASGHHYVSQIFGPASSGGGLLVAARRDAEARGTSAPRSPSNSSDSREQLVHQLSRLVPRGPVYTFLARSVRREQASHAAARLLEAAGLDHSDRRRMTIVDLSSPEFATFREYRRRLVRADEVVTDRLHVALPAAILGKRVTMVEAGYHKLSGVYHQSLLDATNVRLVSSART